MGMWDALEFSTIHPPFTTRAERSEHTDLCNMTFLSLLPGVSQSASPFLYRIIHTESRRVFLIGEVEEFQGKFGLYVSPLSTLAFNPRMSMKCELRQITATMATF